MLANWLDAFERGLLQRLAMADLRHTVARVNHCGVYSCRITTGRHDRLSEHAYGLAIDISFRLSDGETISIQHDWSRPGPESNFLHQLAHAGCGYFLAVLAPDSSADHFNHIHLDIGPDRLCSI